MRTPISFFLKFAVSVSVLVFILSRISIEDLFTRLAGGALPYLVAALLLILLAFVLVAFRWRLLARWLGLAVPTTLALRAVFLGLFSGQMLPSAVGTDVVRGWVLARHTGPIGRIVASLVADRLVALFAVCLLLALSSPVLNETPVPRAGLLGAAAVLVSGAVLLAFLCACTGALKRVARFSVPVLRETSVIDGVALQSKPILFAIVIAMAVHAISVVVAALTAAAYGVNASFGLWLSIIPLSVIVSAVPISINGWGVREAAIVALAAPLGLAQADALLVSLTLGALNMLATLPGAVLLLRRHSLDLV